MVSGKNAAFSAVVQLVFCGTLVFGFIATAQASHWSECHFEIIVVAVSETHVTLDPQRFIRGDGTGPMDKDDCLGIIEDGHVLIEDVQEGLGLLTPGARLHGRWFQYGGMSPSGPVSVSGWAFAPLKTP